MIQSNMDFHIDRIVRISLIAAVIWWSSVLLYPFLGILAWALIMSVALYPVYSWLNRLIGDRPVVTASIITLLNLFILVGAIALLTNNLLDWVSTMVVKIRAGDAIIPPPPASINDI